MIASPLSSSNPIGVPDHGARRDAGRLRADRCAGHAGSRTGAQAFLRRLHHSASRFSLNTNAMKRALRFAFGFRCAMSMSPVCLRRAQARGDRRAVRGAASENVAQRSTRAEGRRRSRCRHVAACEPASALRKINIPARACCLN